MSSLIPILWCSNGYVVKFGKFLLLIWLMLPNFVRNVGLCEDDTNYILYRKKIITLINMNTDKIFVRGGQPYEAPSVTPLDILSEGLLCQSGLDRADNGYQFGDDFDLGEI